MAFSVTSKTVGGSGTAASSYTTASITPTANRLLIIFATSKSSFSTVNQPNVSGNGLTWNLIRFRDNGAFQLSAFWANTGASPSAGSITIDFAGQEQQRCGWSVFEMDGADLSTPIVQSARNTGLFDTAMSTTLAAFADPTNNAGVMGYGIEQANTITLESGWTQIHNNTSGVRKATGWRTGEDTSPSATQSAAGTWASISFEVKAATVPVVVTPSTLALTLTTYAPTVTIALTPTPATLALTLTTYAPTVINPQSATPDTVALVLTEYAPTVIITAPYLRRFLASYTPTASYYATFTPVASLRASSTPVAGLRASYSAVATLRASYTPTATFLAGRF
jgi:hypothetical protein